MIDLFEYSDADRVKITDIDGDVFEGRIIDIIHKEDSYDDEHSIVIDVRGRYIRFMESEVKLIEAIK